MAPTFSWTIFIPLTALLAGLGLANFNCPELQDPEITKKSIRLDKTTVPRNGDTFMCQAFDFRLANENSLLHVIGSTPIIDNRKAVYRMKIYSCASRPEQKFFDAPQKCYTSSLSCPDLMNFWKVGEEGECFKDVGFLVSPRHINYVLLQVHWRSTNLDDANTDSSGFTLYLTENWRNRDIGSAMYGEVLFKLPPRQPLVNVTHTCPSECTMENKQDARNVRKIIGAGMWMHEFAVRGQVSLLRNGALVRILVPMAKYGISEQKLIRFDPPVEFRNGDEIKTECYYNTADSSTAVRSGMGRNDEMCMGFISYYPASIYMLPENRMDRCFSFAGIQSCKATRGRPYIEDGCDIKAMRLGNLPKMVDAQMSENECYMYLKTKPDECSPKCMDYLKTKLWPSNTCYNPRRALMMTKVLATGKFLYDPATKGLIARTLSGQKACIDKLNLNSI